MRALLGPFGDLYAVLIERLGHLQLKLAKHLLSLLRASLLECLGLQFEVRLLKHVLQSFVVLCLLFLR